MIDHGGGAARRTTRAPVEAKGTPARPRPCLAVARCWGRGGRGGSILHPRSCRRCRQRHCRHLIGGGSGGGKGTRRKAHGGRMAREDLLVARADYACDARKRSSLRRRLRLQLALAFPYRRACGCSRRGRRGGSCRRDPRRRRCRRCGRRCRRRHRLVSRAGYLQPRARVADEGRAESCRGVRDGCGRCGGGGGGGGARGAGGKGRGERLWKVDPAVRARDDGAPQLAAAQPERVRHHALVVEGQGAPTLLLLLLPPLPPPLALEAQASLALIALPRFIIFTMFFFSFLVPGVV